MEYQVKEANCFTIVLGGEAGQGIQFIETLLVRIVKISGYHVFATKEYMSRIRGGINTTEISISSGRIRAHRDRIDLLFPLKDGVIEHLGSRVSSATLIVGDKKKIQGGTFVHAPLSDIASDLGNSIFANAVALGVICGFLEIDPDLVNDQIKTKLASKSLEIVENNLKAADKGFAIGKEIRKSNQGVPKIAPDRSVRDELLLTGADAVALGAFAGGCNAVFAYPMTPGTSLFTLMAGFSKEADILVEQVEDEIGVINMALGAWYAGARALVTTSGGGFALMTEGISLAGMIETPVVVHLAQRPGPATGLPTRTEQGDLNLALYLPVQNPFATGETPAMCLPGTIGTYQRIPIVPPCMP